MITKRLGKRRPFIADTSVWSPFLRKSQELNGEARKRLRDGISNGAVHLLGIIKQECLSGIRENQQYERLKEILGGFPEELATSEDHLRAAELFNICRRNGIQGSTADFLICSQSIRLGYPVLTMDKDFTRYAQYLPILLMNVK